VAAWQQHCQHNMLRLQRHVQQLTPSCLLGVLPPSAAAAAAAAVMFIISVAGVCFNILIALTLGVHAHLGHSHGPGGCSGHDHSHSNGEHSHGHEHEHKREHSHTHGDAPACTGHNHSHAHSHSGGSSSSCSSHEGGGSSSSGAAQGGGGAWVAGAETQSAAAAPPAGGHGHACSGHHHHGGEQPAATAAAAAVPSPRSGAGVDETSIVINLPAGASAGGCGLSGHALACRCTISRRGSHEIEVRYELPSPATMVRTPPRSHGGGGKQQPAGGCGHSHGPSHEHGGAHSGAADINLRGAVLHVIGDLLQSVGMAVAGALIWAHQDDPRWFIVDPICTFVFSGVVLLTTKSILGDIFAVLMERTPHGLDVPAVSQVRAFGCLVWLVVVV
jgi:zinc transporter 2